MARHQALSTLPAGAGVRVLEPMPQASSDRDMVEMWLGNYRSPNTRARYATDVAAFRGFVLKPLAQVTVRDIQAFAASLVGLAPATIGGRLTGVKSLISLAHRVGYIPFDVGAPVQLPAVRNDLAERILTEEQVQRLLWHADSPGRRGPLIKRNAAMLRLLYVAGLRISELCALRWRDLVARDAGMSQVTIFGKGGKTRVVLLTAGISQRLEALRGRASPDDAVFRSVTGFGLCRKTAHLVVKAAAKRAGLPPSVAAHHLRHAHVSHALDRGCPIHVVQSTVGHASLTTTTRYTHARPGDSSSKYLAA